MEKYFKNQNLNNFVKILPILITFIKPSNIVFNIWFMKGFHLIWLVKILLQRTDSNNTAREHTTCILQHVCFIL